MSRDHLVGAVVGLAIGYFLWHQASPVRKGRGQQQG